MNYAANLKFAFKKLKKIEDENHPLFEFNNLASTGLEPVRPQGQEILSLQCLPFHHPGNRAIIIKNMNKGK